MKPNQKRLLAAFCLAAAAVLLAAFFLCDFYTAAYTPYEVVTVAMGTQVTVKTYGADRTREVTDAVVATENAISWRVPESAVALLNAAGLWQDGELAELLAACNGVSAATDGAFDVTVLPIARLWGIGTAEARVPTAEEITAALPAVGYTEILIDGDTVSLAVGQGVDLGAVGKGVACDRVHALLAESDVSGAVVSVGGSVLVYGARDRRGSPWKVAVRDPFAESGTIGYITLRSGVVSTSGDYEKYIDENGVRYHHILDARTGYPCDSGLASVTVVADSGLYSDALSTACFLLGKEQGSRLLKDFGAAGIFVEKDGSITTVGDLDFTEEVRR